MRTRALELILLGALAFVLPTSTGCSSHTTPPTAPAVARWSQTFDTGQPAAPELVVELRAPSRVAWISSSLGPAKPTLVVVVTNPTRNAADISDLRVHLEAVRDGISFRCANSVGPPTDAREPALLAPGSTAKFDRTLDCALPLTGRYTVLVGVSFGQAAWREPHPVRTFTLDVQSGGDVEPRPVVSIPGLWAAVGASKVLVGESRAGLGRVAISLVNGGAAPISLPPLRLALRVYRAGSPIPCEDEPKAINAPALLPAGATHREPLDVSCLGLGTPGKYEVAARLLIDDPDTDFEIGRLRIEISNNPASRVSPLVLPGPR